MRHTVPSRIPRPKTATIRAKISARTALLAVRRSSQELIQAVARQLSLSKIDKGDVSDDKGRPEAIILPIGFPLTYTEWSQIWGRCLGEVAASYQRGIPVASLVTLLGEKPFHTESEFRNGIVLMARTIEDAPSHKTPNLACYCTQKNSPNDLRNILQHVQDFLDHLSYNHLGNTFFDVPKQKGANRIFELGREICSQGLPIKCLEAAVVAASLTLRSKELERFMMSFKSECNKAIYRHIVLVLRFRDEEGKYVYGALGLSRRDTLMWKEAIYGCLYDLVADFEASYEEVGHQLQKVKLGLPITHNPSSIEPIVWKKISIVVADRPRAAVQSDILDFTKALRGGVVE